MQPRSATQLAGKVEEYILETLNTYPTTAIINGVFQLYGTGVFAELDEYSARLVEVAKDALLESYNC